MNHTSCDALRLILVIVGSITVSGCGGSTTNYSAPPEASQGVERRKVPAMSIAVHKRIQKAQQQIDLKNYALAHAELEAVFARQNVNDYERAVAWQLKAMLSYEQNNTQGTIQAYENILNYSPSIPVALELNIIYGLAQLYYSVSNYDAALQYVSLWEPRAGEYVRVAQLAFIAQIHYMRREYQETINYMDRLTSMLKQIDIFEIKENWYGLKLSAHWELKQFSAARDTLNTLMISWPKQRYCVQMAGLRVLEPNGMNETEVLESVRADYESCADVDLAAAPQLISRHELGSLNDQILSNTSKNSSPVPLVRVQPQYPRKAAKEKVDGEVIIELTISEDGSVNRDSIIIIEATPEGYFEQAAIRAASMFKYKPQIINGQPQKVEGVRYKFTWEIAD